MQMIRVENKTSSGSTHSPKMPETLNYDDFKLHVRVKLIDSKYYSIELGDEKEHAIPEASCE